MITLRELTIDDIHDEQGYVEWLNDPEVTRYLECRHQKHTLETTRSYVAEMHKSKDNYLFGIFLDGKHIGNMKLGNINHMYKRAEIGSLISKEYWGRGIGTEAHRLTEEFAFKNLGLHKVYAGVYAKNPAALKAVLRIGWRLVGEYEDHAIVDGEYVGCFMIEKINPSYTKEK